MNALADRAEALRDRDPFVVPYARERALLLLDIEYERAIAADEYKHAAEIAHLAVILTRV